MISKFTILTMLAGTLVLAGGCSGRLEDKQSDEIRIVSLAPSLTEIVCALGAQDLLVGRTTACDYPDSVKQVAAVGGFGKPSLELLVSVDPTVVLSSAMADHSTTLKMKELGLNIRHIDCQFLDDIPAAIIEIGDITGKRARAAELAGSLKNSIADLRQSAEQVENRPLVYAEIWNDPVYTIGKKSFLSELIWLAGGKNIGDESNREYFKVSDEWVIAAEPEIILCLYMARKSKAINGIRARPGWSAVPAVKEFRVYDGFENNLVLRPGPRVLEGLAVLKEKIAR